MGVAKGPVRKLSAPKGKPASTARGTKVEARAPGPAIHAVAAPSAESPRPDGPREPLWLVRIVLVLFLVGFAAFLAREVRGMLDATGVTRSMLYWGGVGVGLAVGALAAILVALALRSARRADVPEPRR